MIHILPRFDDRIVSDKSPEELFLILNSVTDTRKTAFSISSNAEFIGKMTPPNFKIVSIPKIYRRNSFLPVIEGTICIEGDRTVIGLRFHLHWFVRIFLTIWFGMAGFSFLVGLLLVLTEGNVEFMLTAALFVLLGQALVRSAFYIPAWKTAARLRELLDQP